MVRTLGCASLAACHRHGIVRSGGKHPLYVDVLAASTFTSAMGDSSIDRPQLRGTNQANGTAGQPWSAHGRFLGTGSIIACRRQAGMAQRATICD